MKCPALVTTVKNSLPFIGTPAIKGKHYTQVNGKQILARAGGTAAVAWTAMSTIGLGCGYATSTNLAAQTLCSLFSYPPLSTSLIAGMMTGLVELGRVGNSITTAKKQKALEEFRNALFPALDYTELARDKNLIKFLIEQKVDLTKKNQEGKTLLNQIVTGSTDPETFIHVYQNADWSIEQKCDAIKTMALVTVPLLKEAVEQGIIKGADFPSEQQVRLLSSLASPEIVPYLKRAGFDLNAKDKEGYTPLLRIAEGTYSRFSAGLAHELLSQGANPTATVMKKVLRENTPKLVIEYAQKNALQLATERGQDKDLIAVLENHTPPLEITPKSTMPAGA